MNTKDNILDNLSEYSPRQLAEYVDKGVITWDDMRDTGDLTPSLRKAIGKGHLLLVQNRHFKNIFQSILLVSSLMPLGAEFPI